MGMASRILAIDDEPAVTYTLKRILERRGYVVEVENDSTRALATAKAFRPDVVIVDSGLTGALDLIANIRNLPNGNRAMIYYTVTKADLRCLMAGKRAGASDFLLKPFDRKVLGAAFSAMISAAAA